MSRGHQYVESSPFPNPADAKGGFTVAERTGMRLSRTHLLVSVVALAAVAGVAATPQLLGTHVAAAFGALAGADQQPLVLAAIGFVVAFVATVAAWRIALQASGARISFLQAGARIGVGALVNSFAPAKLGDAVKVALCSRAIEQPGRIWRAGGAYAGLAAVRSLLLAGLVVVASLTGAMPLWPVFALAGVAAALALTAACSRRVRRHPRVAHLLDGLAAIERSPRALAAVVGWTLVMVVARFLATVAVASALELPHPVLAALVIMPALDVAGAFPITPGGIGIGSGAVAVALASRGIGMTQALGAGFAIQALETLVSLAIGGAGALYLLGPTVPGRRWLLRLATVGASAALAAVVGVVLLNLV